MHFLFFNAACDHGVCKAYYESSIAHEPQDCDFRAFPCDSVDDAENVSNHFYVAVIYYMFISTSLSRRGNIGLQFCFAEIVRMLSSEYEKIAVYEHSDAVGIGLDQGLDSELATYDVNYLVN